MANYLSALLWLLRLSPATLCTILPGAQHLHGTAGMHHHFSRVAFLAGLVGPFSGTQLTIDVHLSSFAQVFTGYFRQFAEQHHAVPFGLFPHLPCLFVPPGFGGGQRNAGHSAAVWHIANIRVLTQIPYQNNFVNTFRGHKLTPVFEFLPSPGG